MEALSDEQQQEKSLVSNRKIILFDGVCNLCDSLVHFVFARDPRGSFSYCRLQSPTGQSLLNDWNLPTEVSAVVLIDEDRNEAYRASEAVFRILLHLNAPWCWFSYLRFLPRCLTDFGYRLVGSVRYKIWGMKSDASCPNIPGLKRLSLDWKEPLVAQTCEEQSSYDHSKQRENVKDV